MSNNHWPHWLPTVLIVAGVVLLIAGGITFFYPSTTDSSQIGSTPQTPASPPTLSSPTPTQFNSPPPTPQAISPIPTPTTIPATSTPTSTPTSALATSSQLDTALSFNGDTAYQHVLAQVAHGPRPTGSEAGWATGDYLIAMLEEAGWAIEAQEFIFKGVKGRNIVGRMGSGPIIILGAHYDTRPAADRELDPAKQSEWIEGANDGASGVAVLLELARVLEPDKLNNEIWLAFFDAEDRGRLDGWPFSVGARYMAENLVVNPQAVVVVDMVGDANQNIFFEKFSTEALNQEVWSVAAELGFEAYIIPQPGPGLFDDHTPFLEQGLPAIDIIDFDYPYWHTTADTADKVAPESLERVGRTLEVWLEEK